MGNVLKSETVQQDKTVNLLGVLGGNDGLQAFFLLLFQHRRRRSAVGVGLGDINRRGNGVLSLGLRRRLLGRRVLRLVLVAHTVRWPERSDEALRLDRGFVDNRFN